jgi:hypothetical protein
MDYTLNSPRDDLGKCTNSPYDVGCTIARSDGSLAYLRPLGSVLGPLIFSKANIVISSRLLLVVGRNEFIATGSRLDDAQLHRINSRNGFACCEAGWQVELGRSNLEAAGV